MIFEELWEENYCVEDLITYLNRSLNVHENLHYLKKFEYMRIMNNLKQRSMLGLNTKTQIVGSLAEMASLDIKS